MIGFFVIFVIRKYYVHTYETVLKSTYTEVCLQLIKITKKINLLIMTINFGP